MSQIPFIFLWDILQHIKNVGAAWKTTYIRTENSYKEDLMSWGNSKISIVQLFTYKNFYLKWKTKQWLKNTVDTFIASTNSASAWCYILGYI